MKLKECEFIGQISEREYISYCEFSDDLGRIYKRVINYVVSGDSKSYPDDPKIYWSVSAFNSLVPNLTNKIETN